MYYSYLIVKMLNNYVMYKKNMLSIGLTVDMSYKAVFHISRLSNENLLMLL